MNQNEKTEVSTKREGTVLCHNDLQRSYFIRSYARVYVRQYQKRTRVGV